MKLFNIKDMKGGWFVGDFQPTSFQTKACEVSFKQHHKNEIWPPHIHKIATEINYLIKGKMIIQDQELNVGDIFVIEPNELADPIFLEDCELIVVKLPSALGDKYNV